MKKLNSGLKEGILINITILLISALILLGFALLKITEHTFIKQQAKIATSYVFSIQNSISYAYQIDPDRSFPDLMKSPALKRLLRLYTGGLRFSQLTLVDKALNIIYSSEPYFSSSKLNDNEFKNLVWEGDTKVEIYKNGMLSWFKEENSSIKIYSPIYFGNEIKAAIVGKILLSHFKLEFTKMRGLAFIYIAVDGIVFIVFGWVLLSRGIMKPISKLQKAIEEVSKGAYSHKIDMGEYHEINHLAKSFNFMAEQLKGKTEDLKNTIEKSKKTNIELKTAQKGLIRSEKLAATGRLAAGLAHEIGNPLGSITSYLEFLLKGKDISGKNEDCLMRVQKEVNRIDTIVREFLDLSAPPRANNTLCDIKKIILNTLASIKHRKKFEKIEIVQKVTEKFPRIKLDEHRIQQVFVNILLNAADAIKKNGTITINGETLEQEKKILICISDNGFGINEKDLSCIFDPFFTTKEPGKGTGLGLSVCQKIINDMGGEIAIESKFGKGTKVKICLPIH